MKTWKTVAISVITTASLVTAGATAYNYLQPSHYEGDTFSNAKTTIPTTTTTTTTTNTSTSTSSSSSNTSTSTSDSDTNNDSIHSEPNQSEVLNYQSTYIVMGNTGSTADTYNYCRGFYYIAPTQNLPQSIRVVQIDDNHNIVDEVSVYGEAGTNVNNLSRNELSINSSSAVANAEDFITWLREQAPNGTTQNGLQSNYDYWVENCKYKYN